jgi:WD40 repeat protein
MKRLLVGITLLLLVVSPVLAQEFITPEPERITNMLWSPNGHALAVQTSLGIYLFPANSPYQLNIDEPLLLDGDDFGQLIFTPDSRWLAYSTQGIVRLFDVTSGEQVATISSGARVTFNPSGTILVTNAIGDSCICDIDLWDIHELPEAPRHLMTLKGTEVSSLGLWGSTFSPDETQLASIDSDGAIRLWDLETGQQITTLQSTTAMLRGKVVFSEDGKRLVTASTYPGYDIFTNVYIWNLESLIESSEASLIGQYTEQGISSFAFSHDGSMLGLSFGYNAIQLIDLQSGEEITHIPSVGAVQLGFSEDDSQLFSIDRERNIWIWDVDAVLNYGIDQQVLTAAIVKTEAEAQKYIPTFKLPPLFPTPAALGLAAFELQMRPSYLG